MSSSRILELKDQLYEAKALLFRLESKLAQAQVETSTLQSQVERLKSAIIRQQLNLDEAREEARVEGGSAAVQKRVIPHLPNARWLRDHGGSLPRGCAPIRGRWRQLPRLVR
jgi:hypothetical protein